MLGKIREFLDPTRKARKALADTGNSAIIAQQDISSLVIRINQYLIFP